MGTQINHADSSISSYIIFFMSHLYEYHEFKNVYLICFCNTAYICYEITQFHWIIYYSFLFYL
jgi:hypothetical protein